MDRKKPSIASARQFKNQAPIYFVKMSWNGKPNPRSLIVYYSCCAFLCGSSAAKQQLEQLPPKSCKPECHHCSHRSTNHSCADHPTTHGPTHNKQSYHDRCPTHHQSTTDDGYGDITSHHSTCHSQASIQPDRLPEQICRNETWACWKRFSCCSSASPPCKQHCICCSSLITSEQCYIIPWHDERTTHCLHPAKFNAFAASGRTGEKLHNWRKYGTKTPPAPTSKLHSATINVCCWPENYFSQSHHMWADAPVAVLSKRSATISPRTAQAMPSTAGNHGALEPCHNNTGQA